MLAFEKLDASLATNEALRQRARKADLSVTVQGDQSATTLTIGDGIALADNDGGDVTLAASTETWQAFAAELPDVGYSSLAAMQRAGHLRVDGDLLAYGRNLLFLEQLFAELRPHQPSPTLDAVREPYIEPVVGRYLHLDLNGKPHRIYFEEAGEGIPLICLHTAGADGRQFRALLNDPDVTRDYRVVAFDLPWHGKSSPPAGFETVDYKLTTDLYVDTVMAVCRALKLDRPAVIGCSIGGRAVLHLALRHGEAFRAAIGLQSATHADPGADTRMRELGLLHRPDVHGQEAAAGTVACLISPSAPNADRWETLWHYMQGGPGIFLGDIHYYFDDGDLRNGLLDELDPERCPLYLLTGEYDLSATPALTAELAKMVKARHFEVMKGLGHFPMSESPEQFRGYLLPVLHMIKAQAD
ncbi:MAG: alpha/beta hydrolase [Alphaproteobacteria bacterium]